MCRSDINNVREDILLKGYASTTDVMKFIPCGYDKAKKIIDEITKMVEEKGKRVFIGIRSVYLLPYVELTETQVHKYAELEREKMAAKEEKNGKWL